MKYANNQSYHSQKQRHPANGLQNELWEKLIKSLQLYQIMKNELIPTLTQGKYLHFRDAIFTFRSPIPGMKVAITTIYLTVSNFRMFKILLKTRIVKLSCIRMSSQILTLCVIWNRWNKAQSCKVVALSRDYLQVALHPYQYSGEHPSWHLDSYLEQNMVLI